MSDAALETLVGEAKSNKLLSSLSGFSQDDILQIWSCVSAFIMKSMQARRGVSIPNFGTFTFSQIKIDVGIRSDLLTQRPVFMAAERFLQTLGIQQTKVLVCGEIPVQLINYAAISVETPFSREAVETCVHHVLHTLQKSVVAQRNVEFTFAGLGRLYIRNARLKMKFFKEFVNSLDDSGAVLDAMKSRPATADSVMSEIATARTGAITSLNTVRLPRNAGDEVTLKSIKEEDEGFVSEGRNSALKEDETQTVADSEACCACKEHKQPDESSQGNVDGVANASRCETRNSRPGFSARPLHIVNMQVPQLTNRTPTARSEQDWFETGRRTVLGTSNANESERKLPRIASTRSSQADVQASCERKDAAVGAAEEAATVRSKEPKGRSSSCNDCRSCHSDASSCGQELCYVCFQRAKLNVPIYFDEERRRQDRAEENMLNKFHEMKVNEFLLDRQRQSLVRRHEAQKIAAFNRGAADAFRNQKVSKSADFSPSFIFQQRPKTPPKITKQDEYNRQLAEQVAIRSKNREKLRTEESFLDELEQQQLASELADQRMRYLQNKAALKLSYKDALDMQLNTKVDGVPPREPDSSSPVFGKNDARSEDLAEQKRRAVQVAQHQLDTVENKRKLELIQKLKEQQNDEEILKRNAHETMHERARRFQELYNTRKALERDWIRDADEKLQRELAEFRATMGSPGGLVQQQMDKYKRCAQCKRKLQNTGEWNVWAESRYVTGTRYMM